MCLQVHLPLPDRSMPPSCQLSETLSPACRASMRACLPTSRQPTARQQVHMGGAWGYAQGSQSLSKAPYPGTACGAPAVVAPCEKRGGEEQALQLL